MAGKRALVYGTGVSGRSVARHLADDGVEVVLADDDTGEGPKQVAAELGVELVVAPGRSGLEALASRVDEVVVSPGVPAHHLVFDMAASVPVVGEVEIAWRRARVPIVAVTGTNGKTTVVTLVAEMLGAAGRRVLCAGNIGLPLLDAVDSDAELLVVEVSSFQLALTKTFRPAVGAWVNLAPDHLDWHPSFEHYRASKARLWANAGPGDVVVANAEDPMVMEESRAPARRGAEVVTFGLRTGDFTVRGDELVAPHGALCTVGELARPFPHEIADGLCAAAAAVSVGAELAACGCALRRFRGLPHRLELVGEANGVRFFDDSKATTPDAVLAALSGFDAAVLIAGGRNKGLDLSSLGQLAPRLSGVVAIGEAAAQVSAVFDGSVPVRSASSMDEAVRAACSLARPGDAVVLSPACTSFDWYGSYAERGEDFARAVRAVLGPGRRAP